MKKQSPPISGILASLSYPINHIEEGMQFLFDGKELVVSSEEPLTPVDVMQIWSEDVNAWFNNEPTIKTPVIIQGTVKPSGASAYFHVSPKVGTKDQGYRLGVYAYWIIYNGTRFDDVGRINFTGLCVDSFCPMTNIKFDTQVGLKTVTVASSAENDVDLGQAIIQGQQINYSAEAYWRYEHCRGVTFASSIYCDVANLTYDLLRRIYACTVAALRFCLGRSNTSLEISLQQNTPDGWEHIGEFQVLQSSTRIADEFDELHIALIRASDIGTHFGTIVSAFANNELTMPDLPQSRADANIITSAKVIELASAFERGFRKLHPDGVEHSNKTQRINEAAKAALNKTIEELTGKPKDKVKYLLGRIDDDSLSMRIRFACKRLPEDIRHSVFNHTKVNPKYAQVGNRFTNMRNDIAHGNEPRQSLSDIREEYKLMMHLVCAMRLMQLEIPNEDIARLVNCKG